MSSLKRIYAIFIARNIEFFRDRAAFAWQFIFPVLIIVGFSFSFDEQNQQKFTVGVLSTAIEQTAPVGFLEYKYINFVSVDDKNAGILKVERHTLDMLIDPKNAHYWINEDAANGYILEKMMEHSAGANVMQKKTLRGDPIRYIDWVIPGILGMNIMFSALWGIGFVIVRYRKNGVLKRLKATPVKSAEFLTAQLASRIWLIMANGVIIFAGLNLLFNFRMHGRYLDLFVIFMLGGICLISIGLIISARIKNEELASGLLNLISWPMMFLSGLWFSMEGAHPYLKAFSELLPLTHVTRIARSIMLDGASMWDTPLPLLYLFATTLFFLALGSRLFKWE